ncbi:hypothetical protein A3C87_03445 [Candidatus Kaiserbacteria bacterium RIFCSPHIGHO2_02_FULL_49_34]|uniref:Glutamyl-tRNA amidotransferase n=1 Tax=Candidatus Kaiserbacteria bacterium RIFCSPHIGHO2_02_FULL_49_34 TaxID=1798491 RepID=A0A1F6DIM1_9BACT|nr:MAG: hypothetical protein A3C87_03445 [Candidatus Kaiserbacteria bacterium RIFCSPHIGHO2_02_FULL_49_34]
MLHEEIKGALKDAMKARDEVRLRTVRSMLTAFMNELVATGKKPQEMLDDSGVLAVIKRLAKQRKDSIEQFTAAGRDELAQVEKDELAVLETYLPTLMSRDAIRPIAAAKIAELGVVDKSKMGLIVGSLMKDLAGQADGGDVKSVIEELLA